MVENMFKVPKKQWKKWNDQERYIFNDVFLMMTLNQSLFLYPDTAEQSEERWRTTCWNAAWTAADSARDYRRENS